MGAGNEPASERNARSNPTVRSVNATRSVSSPAEVRGFVLVTGGAGYIGSHTARALHDAGYTPVVYDNLVTGNRDAVRWGPFEHGDVLDRRRLDTVLGEYGVVAIIHLAGLAYVGDSIKSPGSYYRTNTMGSLVVLEAARDHGIADFIFSSSCAVYGIPDNLPVTIHTQTRPISPYGASKYHVEQMLRDFGAAHGGKWVALRYFNAAGAEPDASNGELHVPETRIVPLAIDTAHEKRGPVLIFGDRHITPDGTCVRDYVHVCDLADAHVAALRYLAGGGHSRAFNLGSGKGSSVAEVIETVERVTHRPVARKIVEPREGDPPVLYADPEDASHELGWWAKRSSLEQIVQDAYRWRQRLWKSGGPFAAISERSPD